MAKKSLYLVAVLYQPAETKDAQGNDTTPDAEIVIPPKYVLATNADKVHIMISREIPNDFIDRVDELQILVKPF